MDPWLTHAVLSARTSRVTFGTGVTCPTYRHHPAEVAQAFASLGIFAPGRVFLGVGTGEALNEQAATGQFGRYQERADRLVEAVALIRQLWSGEPVSFTGAYYQTVNAQLYDVPSQLVPIYVAASGPKSARIAGEHGDGWIMGAQDIKKPELHEAFRQGAEAAGKDPDAMPKIVETLVVGGGREEVEYAANLWRFTLGSWNPELLYDPDPRSIQRKAKQMFPLEEVSKEWPKGEDPTVHAQTLQQLLDAGATKLFFHSGQRGEQQPRVIDSYGSQVLPLLRQGQG